MCLNPHWPIPGHNQPDTLMYLNTHATNTSAFHYQPLTVHFSHKCICVIMFFFFLTKGVVGVVVSVIHLFLIASPYLFPFAFFIAYSHHTQTAEK